MGAGHGERCSGGGTHTCGQQCVSASPALGDALGGLPFGFVKAKAVNDCSEALSGWKGSPGSFFPPILVSPPSQEVAKESSKQQLLKGAEGCGCQDVGGSPHRGTV